MSFYGEYKKTGGVCNYWEWDGRNVEIKETGITQELCIEKIMSVHGGTGGTGCSELGISNANNLAGNINSLGQSFLGLEIIVMIGICCMKILKQLRPIL